MNLLGGSLVNEKNPPERGAETIRWKNRICAMTQGEYREGKK